MSYYFARTLHCSFDEAVQHTTVALKSAGFGIITEIDVTATFKQKLGIDFRGYRILGACNPSMAREALEIEDKVGTMLPCNVIIQDIGGGAIEVAAINPVASISAVNNNALHNVAKAVGEMLKNVVGSL